MPLIDLGAPCPVPADLLDGLPRRVALTLPELRHVAERAGGSPLPFDVAPPRASEPLESHLGRRSGTGAQASYTTTLAALHNPATSLDRRGLLVDGVLDEGLRGAVGLLATPAVALDVDVAVGEVRARAWHRQRGGAVAVLSTVDGIVFELA